MAQNTGLVFKMFTDLTNFQSGLKKAGNDLNSFNNNLKNIGGAIAGVFSTAAIINFGKEAVQLASSAEAIERAFARIGGQDYLAGMKEATRGTVSELELMKQAVRAENFQIPLDQLATLFEFARRRAEETGQSVDYLVDSIVIGIGRKSPLILDNLGISTTKLKEELKGVSTEAAGIGDVAAAVGRIARQELEGMGDEAVTAGQKIGSITAQWQDMKLAIGKVIMESETFASALEAIQVVIRDIQGKNAVFDAEGLLMQGINKFDTSSLDGVKKAINEVQGLMVGLNSHYDTAWERFWKGADANKAQELNNQLNYMYQNLKKMEAPLLLGENLDVPSFNYDALKKDVPKIVGIINTLNESLKKHKLAQDAATDEKTIMFHQREITLLEMKLERIKLLTTAIGKMTAIEKKPNVTANTGKMGLANGGAKRTGNSTVNIGDNKADIYELTEYSNQVTGILQDFKSNISAELAEGFGQLIAGDVGLDQFFESIIVSVLNFASAFGKQIIALGFAKTALDKLFLVPGGGAAAIIAGGLLVAMAEGIKSQFSKGPQMPGLATGTNYVPNDGPYFLHQGEAVVPKKYNDNSGFGNTIPVVVTGRISGRDIALTQARESYHNSRITGR